VARYSTEFKENAVNLFRREGITRTCRKLHVTRATVYRWVRSAESESSINSQIDCETIMESGNRHGCITIAGVAKK
jgi:transposase-like protein